jgi:hypothetical protein
MSRQTRAGHPIYGLLPTDVEGFDTLAELALDMRWSWNHCADEVWRQLDCDLWEVTHNPWGVLQTVSRDQLQRTLADPGLPQENRCPRAIQERGGNDPRVVSAESSTGQLHLRGVFQHGVHVERGPSDLFGRTRQRCG